MNTAFRIDDRGVARGLGAVLLAVTIYVTLTRFGEDWKAFPEFLISALAAGVVLFLALRHRGHSDARDRAGRGPGGVGSGAGGPGGSGGAGAVAVGGPEAGGPGAHGHAAPSATPEDDRYGWIVPPGWQSAMLVSGFVLSAIALVFLADLLGADTQDLQSGTVTWVSLVLAVGFAVIALRTGSAICIFLAALALVTMVLAAIDWIFSPEEPDTYRWILLLLTIGLLAAGAVLYRQRPRHGTVVVVVGGLTLLALGFLLAAESLGAQFGGVGGAGGAADGAGTGWELVILIGAVALTLFAIATREPGPGYVAAFVLLTFVALVAEPNDDDASLIGWPIILLLLAAAALAAGFRPGGDDDNGGHRDRGAGSGGPVVAGPRDDPGDTTREVRL